jgi:RNA polymerase sigma factor (sigma-70 family)
MTSAAPAPTSPSTTLATPMTARCTSAQGHAAPETALDAMSQYMSEMRGIAPLAEGEECRLLDAIHAGDAAARERLVLAFQPWLLSLARRYAAGSEHLTLLDYVQEGNVGLLESMARHADSTTFTKPVAFRTWAYWWVRGQMRQAFWRFEGRGALPERQARLVVRLAVAQQELLATLGREPTAEELAERLQLPVRTILQLLLLQQVEIVSIERLTPDEVERMATTQTDSSSGRAARIRSLVAQLPDRQRQVVVQRYGLADGVERTQRAVAQLLGLSLMTVEEADRRARLRLRRWLKGAPSTTSDEVA